MSVKKMLSVTIAAGALVAGLSVNAQARDLTVVGWGGASQEVHRNVYFDPFSKKSGVALTEDSYNGGLAKIKAMVDTNSVTWDALLVEAPELLRGCENGLFEPMAWDTIGKKMTLSMQQSVIVALVLTFGPSRWRMMAMF